MPGEALLGDGSEAEAPSPWGRQSSLAAGWYRHQLCLLTKPFGSCALESSVARQTQGVFVLEN